VCINWTLHMVLSNWPVRVARADGVRCGYLHVGEGVRPTGHNNSETMHGVGGEGALCATL
jgi:hypothetical protein